MRTTTLAFIAAGLLGAVASCTPATKPARQQEPDTMGDNENPALLIPGGSSLLADNISAADAGQTFGTDDAHIPYPDTYWPFTSEGVDNAWNGGASPLEKYAAVAAPSSKDAAKKWEHDNHGNGVSGVQGWFGHCPGWTGAAMFTAPILHPVYVKSDGNGGVEACSPGDTSCTKFEIGDINALAAEAFVDGASSFIGARCDKKASDIKRDSDGRIVRDGSGCHGLNPGALLVVLGQRMKRLQQAIAIDAQNDFNTDQIWNQPAYRYTVNRFQTLAKAEAANLVAHGTTTGDRTDYPWDIQAGGFALVDISILWVSENGPNTAVVSGADSTRTTRFVAVIETDLDPSDPNARIIGGEYLDDASVGADRLTVPPFVWVSNGPGPDSPWGGGNGHNPYVHPGIVMQLIQLGSAPDASGTGSSASASGAGGSNGASGTSGAGGSSGTSGAGGASANSSSSATASSSSGGAGGASGTSGSSSATASSTGGGADPCSVNVTCGSCTQAQSCGWCSDVGACVGGTDSGPSNNQCGAASWAWLSSSCP